ncbi:MAG: PD-(D/E)XK nuclease family protein [Myxococcota bacterium]
MEALLRRLELLTGLPPVHQRSNGRFARWHRAVRRDDDGTRAYSRSADVDPIGVSQHLLSLRDDLKRSGWRDQVLRGSQRLEALDRLDRSVEVASSVADRIHRVIDELRTLGSLGLTLVLSEPERHLAASDRALVDAIRGAGGEVRGVGDDDIPTADTDLGRVQRAVLGHDRAELIGDGTVRMLTTDTPWEAAERLCAGPTQVGEAWVVADEGPLLDRARARFALPRFGMEPVAPEWPVDELLDLAFDIAHNPRDVRAIHAFLTLPTGPLPAALARSLARVLQNEPAPWGAAWVLAVEQAASSAARAAHRSTSDPSAAAAAAQELRALVGRWFPDPAAPRPANAEDHRRLVNELACWAVETGAPLSTPLEGLVELLDGLPPGPLDRGTLGQLLSLVRADRPRAAAEAGHPAFSRRPGACLPADHIVWWGAVGPAAANRLPWTSSERSALAEHGIEVPSSDHRRQTERGRWVRPILAARRSLTLVTWRTSRGVRVPPHPILDELRALVDLQRCSLPEAVTTPIAVAPPIPLRSMWRVPPRVTSRTSTLSATSVDLLLGCPLRFTLHYLADLQPGAAQGPMDGARLAGALAHRVFQSILLGPDGVDVPSASPEEVSHRTLAAVERCIAEVGPGLLEAGRAAERARLTRQIVHAAGELAEQLRAGGWWPVAAEARVEGRFAGQPFGGFVDLDVARSDGAVAVVDIKLGHSASRRTELTEGRALQLAMYASGRREDPDRWPVAAYFVVQDARMIATSDDFPEAVVTGGPSLAQTWRDAEHGALAWFRELHSGRVHARDPDLPAPPIAADVPSNPLTTVAAPCGTCEFRVLCSPRTTS